MEQVGVVDEALITFGLLWLCMCEVSAAAVL